MYIQCTTYGITLLYEFMLYRITEIIIEVHPIQDMKAQKGSRGIALLFLYPRC